MNSDFFSSSSGWVVDILKGKVPGHRIITLAGHNQVVGSSIEDIWNQGGIYVWPTAATPMTVSSTSSSDTALGIGARTVLLQGLNANYEEVEEIISLAGQTPVVTVNSYLRLHGLRVLTVDDSNELANLGNIYVGTGTVVAGVPATVHLLALTGENVTAISRYTVPANHTGFILEHGFSVVGSNDRAECYILSRKLGEVFRTRRRFMLFNTNFVFPGYANLPEKSDVVARARMNTGSTDVASHIVILLVENDA